VLKKVNAKKQKANLPSKEGKRNPVERLGFFDLYIPKSQKGILGLGLNFY
jgi:hypothetical protein